MSRTGMSRRVLACTFLLVTLALSGLSWAPSPTPGAWTADTALTLVGPPGLAIDAALTGRSDLRSDQQADKTRPGSEPAVLAALGLLLVATVLVLARSSSVPRTPGRRSGVALRAPPRLRLA